MVPLLGGFSQALLDVLPTLRVRAGEVYENLYSMTGWSRPRAYTDSILSDSLRKRIEALFKSLVDSEFLTSLIERIETDTRSHFPQGVQGEKLEDDYARDIDLERIVALKCPNHVGKQWKRVCMASQCQTLPNYTIGGMLTQLRKELFALKEGMNFVKTRTVYRVELEEKGEHLRIRLIFSVFMESLLQSLELSFQHIFVVKPDGSVVKIEETKVEKIPHDPLPLDYEEPT